MRKKENHFTPKSENSASGGQGFLEQAAGFLRIPESSNILDITGVHPENYSAVKELLKRLDIKDQTRSPVNSSPFQSKKWRKS